MVAFSFCGFYQVHDATDTDAATTSKRQFLRPSSPVGSAPTSRGSSSPAPPDGDGMGVGGNRERRTRKSVNYAEPKLNTYVQIYLICFWLN
jgi:hypothetical protein